MAIKSLGVFCGASTGANPEYVKQARELASLLCERNITLVYGGGNIGIMGEFANAMLQNGGDVIGVMTHDLAKKEIAHVDIAELHIVDTLHERKALMSKLADGFILLPGGLGSLDEFFEALTWANLGLNTKPNAILNTKNYYDPLLKFLDSAVKEQFIRAAFHSKIIVQNNPLELLNEMMNYEAPLLARWDEQLLEESI